MTSNQQSLVLENIDMIAPLIRRRIVICNGLEFEDLYQVGCLALCKAALTYNGSVPFGGYAHVVVLNSLLQYAQRHNKRRKAEAKAMQEAPSSAEMDVSLLEVYDLMANFVQSSGGITQKGAHALYLKSRGFQTREIAERYGVTSNVVAAWVSRATGKLLISGLIAS